MEDSGLSHDQKKLKPLGQRLIEKGYTSERRSATSWSGRRSTRSSSSPTGHNGVFLYDEPEQMPHFQVAIEGDVQGLLLDAYRRIDEGERARKTRDVVENEVCFACPVVDECTGEIRTKHLKKDVCLWREMGAVLDEGYDRLRDSRQLYRSRDEDAKTSARRLPRFGMIPAGAAGAADGSSCGAPQVHRTMIPAGAAGAADGSSCGAPPAKLEPASPGVLTARGR